MSIMLRHNLCCEVLLRRLLLWKLLFSVLSVPLGGAETSHCSIAVRCGREIDRVLCNFCRVSNSPLEILSPYLNAYLINIRCLLCEHDTSYLVLSLFRVTKEMKSDTADSIGDDNIKNRGFCCWMCHGCSTTLLFWLFISTNCSTCVMRLKVEISLVYTVSLPDWKYSTGFVNLDMIKDHLPAPSSDVLVVLCGPPPMIQYACMPNLEKLGHKTDNIFAY